MKTILQTLRLSLALSVTMVCGLTSHGWALLAPASTSVTQEARTTAREADMKAIQGALETKMVRERLKTLGLSDAEIEGRLSQLSDEQIHKLAKDIDTLSAGGDVGGILIVVLLVVLIVYLVKRL